MSRPLQRHRKSQSTSALAMLADGPSDIDRSQHRVPKSRRSQHPALGRVAETESSEGEGSSKASATQIHHLGASLAGTPRREKISSLEKAKEQDIALASQIKPSGIQPSVTVENIREWMNQVASLRSTAAARAAALKSLEQALFQLCSPDRKPGLLLSQMFKLNVHTVLLNLLARHTQILSQRTKHPHTYVRANDALVLALLPEIRSIVMLLQGMCLLSTTCHADVSESWVIEMLILLFMLLRLPPPLLDEMGAPLSPQDTPSTLYIIDLFSSILADSPANARKFEKLNGLEAMSRVLKVEGQVDTVKIRCMEFLHFYLMPEEPSGSRNVSSSSSSSTESQLYPPSPLQSSTSSSGSEGHISPSPRPGHSGQKSASLDVPFVPQTPRKPPQPALGYLTPSSRRVSSSHLATPSLSTVPASPQNLAPPSPSAGRPASAQKDNRWSRTEVNGNAGLGLGLTKATSSADLSSLSSMQTDKTRVVRKSSGGSSTFSDPFSPALDSRASSSGSSTVMPSPRTLSRSGTQPTLHIVASSPASHDRRSSIRHVSRSPLVVSTLREEPSPSSSMAMGPPASPGKPREQKMRHSRTQSHLSALTTTMPPPPVPPVPKEVDGLRTPSKARRAFPAGLTKGLPPSASSPHLSSPLGPAKRMPSNPSVSRIRSDEPAKPIKTVEEKKALLGNWLGNVDALVQSVEKVSMWSSKGSKSRR